MRRLAVLTLLLLVTSASAAPAPLPKPERRSAAGRVTSVEGGGQSGGQPLPIIWVAQPVLLGAPAMPAQGLLLPLLPPEDASPAVPPS